MDSFMKNVSFNNKLVTDRLKKMTEDAVKLTTRGMYCGYFAGLCGEE